MTTKTKARLTLEDFLDRSDTKPASEYVCGEVWRKPMPDNAHATMQTYLLIIIHQFLMRTRLGRVLPELRCIFGPPGRERAWVPDIVYASFQTMPPGDARDHPYLLSAPDLAIEVLSRRQPMMRFARKLQFYLTYGVRLVWVVDPYREVVAVFAPGQEERVLRAGDTLDGGDVLPGFSTPVADIFAQLQE